MRLIILTLTLVSLIAGVLYFDPSIIERLPFSISDEIVEDNADLFSKEDIEYIDGYHRMLLERFDLDYRVITLNGERDINLYAAKTFNDRNIGERSKTSRGLLLVIDAKNDLARLEVSASLESVYTDSFVAYLEHRQMVPFFNVGRVADGIFATSEIIRIRAMDAKKGEEFDLAKVIGSIGGGARVKAGIDAGKDTSFQTGQPDVLASDDPQETLRRYIAALAGRNGRNDLDVFTPDSKEFMGTMLSTPAQMDSSVKRLKGCEVEHLTYNDAGNRAVLFHSLKHRHCDPFLFEKGDDGKWRLDLKALGRGTNHTFGNIWYIHYEYQQESGIWKYNFGFQHVYFYRPWEKNARFDHQGIPYYHKYGINMNHTDGNMLITKVYEGSFIEKVGLKKGDRILEWEGRKFIYAPKLSSRLKYVRPGLDIQILVLRDGKLIRKMVQAPPYPKKGEYRFGFSYRHFAPKIDGQYVGLPMVHYIDPGSQGERLGVQKGDIILKWDDKEYANVTEISKWMEEVKPGKEYSVVVYRGGKGVELTSVTQPLRAMSKVH
ncbi:MAG: TPM domain-containing protein [Pseudomonadales bacterium]|nr:TPM domain-containing protein [Pseudomonadales bacterium]